MTENAVFSSASLVLPLLEEKMSAVYWNFSAVYWKFSAAGGPWRRGVPAGSGGSELAGTSTGYINWFLGGFGRACLETQSLKFILKMAQRKEGDPGGWCNWTWVLLAGIRLHPPPASPSLLLLRSPTVLCALFLLPTAPIRVAVMPRLLGSRRVVWSQETSEEGRSDSGVSALLGPEIRPIRTLCWFVLPVRNPALLDCFAGEEHCLPWIVLLEHIFFCYLMPAQSHTSHVFVVGFGLHSFCAGYGIGA